MVHSVVMVAATLLVVWFVRPALTSDDDRARWSLVDGRFAALRQRHSETARPSGEILRLHYFPRITR